MLLKKHNTPENVCQHSLRVCQVALFIVQKLIKKEKQINLYEVQAGALLHDICKIQGIHEKKDHAVLGSALMEKLEYYSVAEIIRQHVVLQNPNEFLTPAAVVNYADKRVKHNEIVSLKERFDDIIVRYGKTHDLKIKMHYLFLNIKEIEFNLFNIIETDPNEVNNLNSLSPFIEDDIFFKL